jgi:hypothetical protein
VFAAAGVIVSIREGEAIMPISEGEMIVSVREG